ncbi:hypothetical protein ACLMJK_001075 [Lecanora helva]
MANPENPYRFQNNYSPEDQRFYDENYQRRHSYAPSPDPAWSHSQGEDYRRRDSYHDGAIYRPRDERRRPSRYDDDYDSDSGFSSEEERRSRHDRRKKSSHKSHSSRSKSSNPRLDKAKDFISTSDRGAGAGMIGAVAGAVIAQETAQRNGKGSIGATIAGLVIGGLAGNVVEKKYSK